MSTGMDGSGASKLTLQPSDISEEYSDSDEFFYDNLIDGQLDLERARRESASPAMAKITPKPVNSVPLFPLPHCRTQTHPVNLQALEGFFLSVRRIILNAIDTEPIEEESFCTPAQWVLVSQHLLIGRIHFVLSSFARNCGSRRRGYCFGMSVPKCYKLLFDDVGTIKVQNGAYTIYPALEFDADHPEPPHPSNEALSCFTRLVMAADHIIETDCFNLELTGAPWWVLSPRKYEDQTQLANELDRVLVLSHFREFSRSDALKAAVVQNHSDGKVAASPNMIWESRLIVDVLYLRAQFVLTPIETLEHYESM